MSRRENSLRSPVRRVATLSRQYVSAAAHLPYRVRSSLRLAFVCASAAVISRAVSAQPTVIGIDDKVSCRDCRMTTALLVSLGEGGAAEIFRAPYSVVMDSRRHIIVARGRDGPPIAFDSLGRLLRVIGREGGGPGEYRSAEVLLLGVSDTLYVIDRRASRLSVLGPNWQFVKSAPIPDGTFSAARAKDGTLVISAEVNDAARFGRQYHAFDGVGNYLHSFGEQEGGIIPGQTPPLMRWVTPASGGGIWSASVLGQYVVERWGTRGVRQTSYARQAQWFPRTGTPRYGFTRENPPSPQVVSIAEDDSGRVWIAIRVSDPNWKDHVRWGSPAGGEREQRPVIEDRNRVNDTIIEVIDAMTGKLIASQRFDQQWEQFVGAGRLLAYETREDRTVLHIHTLALHRGTK